MEVALCRTGVPTLLLASESDPLSDIHRKVTALLPAASGHVFPGHGPIRDPDRAEDFVPVVDAFLRGQLSRHGVA